MVKVIHELALLKVRVSDVTRSADFYRDALGFELLFVAEECGWGQLQAGELPLALYKPGMGGGDGKIGGSVGFHVSPGLEWFDVLAADLLQRGAIADNRAHRGDDGTTFIEVRDPDGNNLKIMRAQAAETEQEQNWPT
jgi:catechol 2,3-dioxygenase-like lactoylglutathione lyase family enzyme